MYPTSHSLRNETPYVFPYFNRPISTNTLRTSQIALGFFSTLSIVGSFYLPCPESLFSGGVCTISYLSLLGSFFMIKKAPFLPTVTLQAVEFQEEMHQLSGINREGVLQNCSDETFKNLVEHLQSEGKLDNMINGLSDYDITTYECYRWRRPLTPLQHWAKRGDLYKVKLLIEKGAADQCLGKYPITSALFESLLAGHQSVVKYLLSVGASSYLTLNSTRPLESFLPKLIYEYCDRGSFKPSHRDSLNIFLSHFQSYAPEGLVYQLKIPIRKGENPRTYVKEYCREFEGKKDLFDCLSAYKKNNFVFDPKELSDNPFTLQELGQEKGTI